MKFESVNKLEFNFCVFPTNRQGGGTVQLRRKRGEEGEVEVQRRGGEDGTYVSVFGRLLRDEAG